MPCSIILMTAPARRSLRMIGGNVWGLAPVVSIRRAYVNGSGVERMARMTSASVGECSLLCLMVFDSSYGIPTGGELPGELAPYPGTGSPSRSLTSIRRSRSQRAQYVVDFDKVGHYKWALTRRQHQFVCSVTSHIMNRKLQICEIHK